jgi:hypothetical protein
LEELHAEPGGDLIERVPRSVWIKTMLVHSAAWGEAGNTLDQILRTTENSRQFKEYLTRLLGYGQIETSRVRECTKYRVTALGGGQLQADQAHVHRFPLPPSLSGRVGLRTLTITLAWLTPVNPFHQAWRRADLWFTPPTEPFQMNRMEADWRAVQRGTVQHEILESDRAAAFVDGDSLEILVNCRAEAGALEEPVPYALAITLQLAEQIGIDVYEEVRVRVHAARVRIAESTR